MTPVCDVHCLNDLVRDYVTDTSVLLTKV